MTFAEPSSQATAITIALTNNDCDCDVPLSYSELELWGMERCNTGLSSLSSRSCTMLA